jgi:hypothetical protein
MTNPLYILYKEKFEPSIGNIRQRLEEPEFVYYVMMYHYDPYLFRVIDMVGNAGSLVFPDIQNKLNEYEF